MRARVSGRWRFLSGSVLVAFLAPPLRHCQMMRLVMEALRQQTDEAETSDALILPRLLTGLRTFP